MEWGLISADGSTATTWVKNKVNSVEYCKNLKENLLEKYEIDHFYFQ